jgi:hypothetical protein
LKRQDPIALNHGANLSSLSSKIISHVCWITGRFDLEADSVATAVGKLRLSPYNRPRTLSHQRRSRTAHPSPTFMHKAKLFSKETVRLIVSWTSWEQLVEKRYEYLMFHLVQVWGIIVNGGTWAGQWRKRWGKMVKHH